MKTSADGIRILKEFEGFRRSVYRDVAGLRTVGYGHLLKAGEKFDGTLTDDQAEQLLRNDLRIAERCIAGGVTRALSQAQFDALASFVFNVGCAAFLQSRMLRFVNAGELAMASAEFPRWVRAGGRVIDGLSRRRAAERALFDAG